MGEAVKRLQLPGTIETVIRPQIPTDTYELFLPETVTGMTRTLEGRGRIFIYSARRGLAPIVFCRDCSYVFRCPRSGAPYSLLETTNSSGEPSRWFVSTTAGTRVRAADTCPDCGSWRLRQQGLGVQHIAEEWQRLFPTVSATIIDQTTAGTPSKLRKALDEFYADELGVLIGTQLAIPHLTRGITTAVVTSLEAVRSTPTWRADEQQLRLLLNLREHTSGRVYVQTKQAADEIITHATRGTVESFCNSEIALRQQVQYPPFCAFVLLTWTGSKPEVQQTEQALQHLLAPFSLTLQCYSDPYSTPQATRRRGLLRLVNQNGSERAALMRALAALPHHITVAVNPDRIV
jgi:primosomal protein N' (replication factor Y)